MNGERRHLQFFGPDYSRGPFAAASPETAGVQLGAALAQLRTPLLRSDDELRAHADFIRELGERLMPDWAAQVRIDVGPEVSDSIQTSIRVMANSFSLLHIWLADAAGGAETTLAPTTVTWTMGAVLHTITTNRRWMIITPATGVASVTVTYTGEKTWYWAVARHGRIFYTSMSFRL